MTVMMRTFVGSCYFQKLAQKFRDPGRSMSNLISAVAWVRRGVAAQHADKYVLDDAELARISSLAHIELEDARLELERAQKAAQAMEKRGGEDEAETDAEEKGEEKDDSDWVE